MSLGIVTQKLKFGMVSVPLDFRTNLRKIKPPRKYTNNKTKNLKLKRNR